MNNNIRAVLKRTNKIRCCKSIVNNQRNVVTMSNFRYGCYINKVGIRVSYAFYENCTSVVLYGFFKYIYTLGGVDKSRGDAVIRECVFQKIICAAVNCGRSDNMLTAVGKSLKRISYRRCAGSRSQSRNAAFQSGNSIFKNFLSRIGQTAVNVARIL